jgi:hypothetical protein
VRRTFEAAVIQVEAINIYVGLQGHKMQKPQDFSGGLAPLARRLGGDMSIEGSRGTAKARIILRYSTRVRECRLCDADIRLACSSASRSRPAANLKRTKHSPEPRAKAAWRSQKVAVDSNGKKVSSSSVDNKDSRHGKIWKPGCQKKEAKTFLDS